MSLARDVTTVGGATLLSRLLGFLRDVVIAAVLGAARWPTHSSSRCRSRTCSAACWRRARSMRRSCRCGCAASRRTANAPRAASARTCSARSAPRSPPSPCCARCSRRRWCCCSRRALRPSPYLYAVYFLRLATPYLAIVGLVAVMAATLNAAGRVGAAAYGPVVFNVVMIAAAARRRARGIRQLAGGRRDPRGRDRGRGNFPAAGGRRRDVPPARSADCAAAQRVAGRAPLLPDDAAGRDRRRHSAAHLIAGTIVASSSPSAVSWLTYSYRLYELPLGIVSIAIASVMTPAIAAHVRADDRAASTSRAIARLRDRARPRAAGRGRPGAPRRADRHRPVRARRVHGARHRRGRRRAGRHCARHPRPRAGKGPRLGVVRP